MGATDSNCCGGREQPNRLIEQEMNSSRQKHAIERNTEIKPIKHKTIQVDEYILHKDSVQYLSFERMNKIKVDDQIDYRNDYGKFMGYNVLDKKGTILTLENCNDDEKSDTIDIDYTKTVNRFAEYGSISKREAHRFLDLIMEDYIDINKDGWRYGEIIGMEKFSGQIQVGFLDSDANYDDYWFHLDNEFQVAKCNTKCDIIMSLKQHIYDPFFNIKKHKNQGKLMMERLEKCFVYIETKILPEKIQEGRLSLISYLNDVYFQLYIESIACEMKTSISCDDMKIMKELFQQKYDPLVETLKTATDEMQVWLKPQDIMINIDEEKKDYDYDYDLSKLIEIKVKWSVRIFDIKYIDDKYCEENTCISIKRVNYIFDLFEKYYINADIEDNRIKKYDFIMIYNKCLSDHYSITQLLNDFHHLQVYHEENILKDANLINQCKIKQCKVNKENKQIDYKQLHEIEVMKNIIKMHICFQHKKKMKKSDLPMLLNVESNEPQTSITRRDTLDMISKSSNTLNKRRRRRRRMIGRPNELIFQKFQTKVKKKDIVTKMPNFEFGQRFYYTKYFKDNKNYIKTPKYSSLKEEMLSNRIHRTKLSILEGYLWKATHHSLSNKAKQLKSKYYGADNQIFEIPANLPITISHLLCIILYTDDDILQKRYKRYGCRFNEYANDKKHLKDLKDLNAEIGWWYSLFYEAVLFYGKEATTNDIFYHGLSVKLLFRSFTPTFNCPISTTIAYDIALQFGGNGIILFLKPTNSSQDRYFDVEWISQFPKEKERIFCQAHSLYINDIRFKETGVCIRQQSTCNNMDLSALRLFDYIVNQNIQAPKKLFDAKKQAKLSKYFKTTGNKQKMDAIKDFNEINNLCMVNELFASQDYDSDCIDFDIHNNEQSEIRRYSIREQKDEDRINRLVSFINEYDEEYAEIPKYLKDLFGFMIQQLKEKKQENTAINMIKSQYNKLNIDLQLKFMQLLSKYDVEYTKEFEWKIEGESFTEFMNLIPQTIEGTTYKRSNAFEFKYFDVENKQQTISFIPQITRIDPSWPKYCSIGVRVGTISCNIASFHWSFGVKEIDYSCDVDIYVENAENGTYDGIKAFKNVKLKKLKKLTLTIYMRRDIQVD